MAINNLFVLSVLILFAANCYCADEAAEAAAILTQQKEVKEYRKRSAQSSKEIPIEVSLQNYLETSSILKDLDRPARIKTQEAIKEGILTFLKNKESKWPGSNCFKAAEQFYWNLLPGGMSYTSVKDLFSAPDKLNWQAYVAFCETYFAENFENRLNRLNRSSDLVSLLPIFMAYPTHESQVEFLNFCEHYMLGVPPYQKIFFLLELLPIFQATRPEDRVAFTEFCYPYLAGVEASERPRCIANLLRIFQAYPEVKKRAEFLDFVAKKIKSNSSDITSYMEILLPIFQEKLEIQEDYLDRYLILGARYNRIARSINRPLFFQAFPTLEAQENFIVFCSSDDVGDEVSKKWSYPLHRAFLRPNLQEFINSCVKFDVNSDLAMELVTIFQTLSTKERREAFLNFCKSRKKLFILEDMDILFPIFQAFPTDESRKPFLDFCKSSDSSFSLRDMGILFPIFQAFPTDESRKSFLNFCKSSDSSFSLRDMGYYEPIKSDQKNEMTSNSLV